MYRLVVDPRDAVSWTKLKLESPTARVISKFAVLPKGWHYGEGGPIPLENIAAAQEVLSRFLGFGWIKTGAFAGAGGELLITAEVGEYSIEFTIEADLMASLVVERRGEEEIEKFCVPREEALRALMAFERRSCCTSDSFTHGHTTLRNRGFDPRLLASVQTSRFN